MNEMKKTYLFIGAAVILVLLAWAFAPTPITPEAFQDQGEPFFPDFTDPNEAKTLEVIDYDQEKGVARPFTVTFKDGLWTIPSHYDYPADGKERLAKTAAGVIGITKDEFRSDNLADHELFGVIDPLSETAGLAGRGKKVTIKGENDKLLAEFIVGIPVEGKQGYRYVRLPGHNRVYAAKMDVDLSARFEDWIDRELLKLNKNRVDKIIVNDYSINERTLRTENRSFTELNKIDDSTWRADKTSSSMKVDTTLLDTMLTTLADLKIVGVRPKPEGFSDMLKSGTVKSSMSQSDLVSLQNKGFYVSRDGQLLANEGELVLETKDGVLYSLRFGEVLYGSGLDVSAGTNESGQQIKQGAEENRYIFITADFDENYFNQPAPPQDTSFVGKPDSLLSFKDRENKKKKEAYDEWQSKVAHGRSIADELNRRFADWYYVISGDSYSKIHLSRNQLVVNK